LVNKVVQTVFYLIDCTHIVFVVHFSTHSNIVQCHLSNQQSTDPTNHLLEECDYSTTSTITEAIFYKHQQCFEVAELR